MKKAIYVSIALGLLLTATSLWAEPTYIYYGGVEDSSLWNAPDYNDLVFSISGAVLNFTNTRTESWQSNPALNQTTPPFWDNTSSDGRKMNIGYCVYGNGGCGSALASSSAQFLATKQNQWAVSDVSFKFAGPGDVTLQLRSDKSHASATNNLGWYTVDKFGAASITWMERGKSTLTLTAKDLGRADSFGVVASTNDGTFWGSDEYFSKDNFWHQSGDHFAWFRDEAPTPNPEPGTLALLGSGLIGVAGVVRRKLNR